MTTKICSQCGEEKPATTEYFNKWARSKCGIRAYCKMCEKEYNREYYKKNAEKRKQRYEKNADKVKQYNKEHSEERAEYSKQYYKKNADKIKAQAKQYYKDNKEAHKEYSKIYYKENAEELRKQKRQYYRKNKDLLSIKKQKRRAITQKLPATLTDEQWQQIKSEFNNSCSYCGMSETEHLDRYNEQLHQEHFVPLSKGGEYTHNNIIPACRSCNSSKQDKDFFEWYPEQELYSERREQKILNYLGYDTDTQTQQLTLANA